MLIYLLCSRQIEVWRHVVAITINGLHGLQTILSSHNLLCQHAVLDENVPYKYHCQTGKSDHWQCDQTVSPMAHRDIQLCCWQLQCSATTSKVIPQQLYWGRGNSGVHRTPSQECSRCCHQLAAQDPSMSFAVFDLPATWCCQCSLTYHAQGPHA